MISSLLYFTPKPDPVSMFIFMLYTQQHSAFRAWNASQQCRSPLELPLPFSQYKHTKCHLCCFGFFHKPHRFLVTLCFSFTFQSHVPQVRKSGFYAFSDAELWLTGAQCLAKEQAADTENMSIWGPLHCTTFVLDLGEHKVLGHNLV